METTSLEGAGKARRWRICLVAGLCAVGLFGGLFSQTQPGILHGVLATPAALAAIPSAVGNRSRMLSPDVMGAFPRPAGFAAKQGLLQPIPSAVQYTGRGGPLEDDAEPFAADDRIRLPDLGGMGNARASAGDQSLVSRAGGVQGFPQSGSFAGGAPGSGGTPGAATGGSGAAPTSGGTTGPAIADGATTRSGPGGSTGSGVQAPVDAGTASPVPEPATWVMLIAGFFLVGWSLRRQRLGQTVSLG